MALTAAEMANAIWRQCGKPEGFNALWCQNMLEEWAAQLQPQPDESDMEIAIEIDRRCTNIDANLDRHKAANIIARHTIMKVAKELLVEVPAAEERGWNMGAEAMREAAIRTVKVDSHQDGDTLEVLHLRSIPLPPYQKKVK